MFWDIFVEKNEDRFETPDETDPELKDFYWNYRVQLEGKEIFSSEILGQYDLEPILLDILTRFSLEFNAALLGFAKDGTKI